MGHWRRHRVGAEVGRIKCLSKADIEVARSKPAAIDRDPAPYLRNPVLRRDRLSGDDRQAGVSQIKGKGTTRGSLEGGGIDRELITHELVLPNAIRPEGAAPIDAPPLRRGRMLARYKVGPTAPGRSMHPPDDIKFELPKAELEIMLLHDKLDLLRESQWEELLAIQREKLGLLRARAA